MKARTYMLVFTNPLPNKEDEFNTWYTNIHMPEILATDGFLAAQRFKLDDVQQMPEQQQHKYLAIYELDTDRTREALENVVKAGPTMTMEPVIDLQTARVHVFETLTDLLQKKA